MASKRHWLKRLFSRRAGDTGGKDPDGVLSPETRTALNSTTILASPQLSLRQTLREAWRLSSPYFTASPDKNRARLLLGGITGLTLGQVGLAIWLNTWRGGLWDSFTDMSLSGFSGSMKEFAVVGGLWIGASVYREYLGGLLQVGWRDWMTRDMQSAWLDGKNAWYRKKEGQAQSPDQRLTTDIIDFVWKTQSLSMSFLNAALSLTMFSGVLWQMGGALEFTMGGTDISLPGYMVGLAAAYAGIGTLIIQKMGKTLPMIHNYRQRYEADFRYSLIRIRENAESIALYKGEEAEKDTLSKKFNHLVRNLNELVRKNKQISWLTTTFGTVGEIVPLVAIAPKRFAGELSIGGMQVVAGAFGHVVGSLSWMMTAFPEFAEYRATTGRLATFNAAIRNGQRNESLIKVISGKDNQGVTITDLTLGHPESGETMIQSFSMILKPGDRLVLTGVIGSGKSSLLRSISGLWDHGQGNIEVGASAKILCVPQKPYLPLQSLRGIVCYPHGADKFTSEQVEDALTTAGLGRLVPYLDDEERDGAYWAGSLSGGEQQRVGFARIFLHKPDVLLLDEVTSSMDPQAESDMYQAVIDKLPDTVIISVAHREKVLHFHTIHGHISEQTLRAQPLAP